jgi:proton-dependent oligopeptide transporter, POT family
VSARYSLQDIRTGFHPNFWVANGMELFERLAYYGQATVLSVFLRDHLRFTEIEVGQLSSIFGGLIYLLPIVGGTLADRFGFRKAFSAAFFILAIGYFLIGSTGMEGFQWMYSGVSKYWALVIILIFTAMGGSFIKPSVLGTVAVTSKPETKSMGYAFYYWIVNIGAAIGPLIAYFVRGTIGIEYVYVVSAVSCALMFLVNYAFYKEMKAEGQEEHETLAKKLRNLVVVLANIKFMIFLLIFALYWIIFWQIFIIVPFYITDFVSKDAPFEIIQSVGAWGIIALQLVINVITKSLPTRTAILVGFAVSSLCWLVMAIQPSIPTIIAGILVFSIGEMTQAPRYYEYISTLAPKGQQGMFQGYAFLPIAIAWGVGGTLGGWLYSSYARSAAGPRVVFLAVFGIGVLATVLMAAYNWVVARQEGREEGKKGKRE